MNKVKELGQVFTEETEVDTMINLLNPQHEDFILEPSVGKGALYQPLIDRGYYVTGIEIDDEIRPIGVNHGDFFTSDDLNTYNKIIANPPYVKYNRISKSTKRHLRKYKDVFNNRTNLYIYFLWRMLDQLEPGGSMVVITPRDFINITSSIPLNKRLHREGTITHFYDYGDKLMFKGFAPNCAIWRFVKGDNTKRTEMLDGVRDYRCVNGQTVFSNNHYEIPFKDLFYVKVGAVSGADDCFVSEDGNKDFVCSTTKTTHLTRRMFYNIKDESLIPYKEKLLERRLVTFTEKNWWKWGRKIYESDHRRVYVNGKTRMDNPFFIHPCRNWDGSLLAIFIRPGIDLTEEQAKDLLNKVDWNELGCVVGSRFIFNQRSLENVMLPSELFRESKPDNIEFFA